MPGVPRCKEDLQIAAGDLHDLFVFECNHLMLRNRGKFAPEWSHLIAVDAGSAVDQLGGIDKMRRTKGMDVDAESRILARQQPGGSGMVEMNVGHQHTRKIPEG